MEQVERERREHINAKFTALVIGISAISGCIGYKIFYIPFFAHIQLPLLFQLIYRCVKAVAEIFTALSIPVSTIAVQYFEIWNTREHSDRYRRSFKFLKASLVVICVVMSTMIGISVAEDNMYSDILRTTYFENFGKFDRGEYDVLSSDEVSILETIGCVRIRFTPPDGSIEDTDIFIITDVNITHASAVDYVLNPFSSLIHAIHRTEYMKYEITLQLPYEKGGELSEPPSSDSSSEIILPNSVFVVIEEIMVKQNGYPLIKLNSTDPQYISYGPSEDELRKELFLPSPDGYKIEFEYDGDCYVQWNGNGPTLVDKSNIVLFEDHFIETNKPFILNAYNLKALFGKKLPPFTDDNLKISIKNLNTSGGGTEKILAASPPLEMTTRAGGILYHLQYGQDSFYFAIHSLSDGPRLINKEDINETDFKLFCELTIE